MYSETYIVNTKATKYIIFKHQFHLNEFMDDISNFPNIFPITSITFLIYAVKSAILSCDTNN